MTASIRVLAEDDVAAVVEFAVRAWKPVFDSFAQVMGPDIYPLVYPDWKAGQARAVEAACRADGHQVWVAEAGGKPVGFAVVAIGAEAKSGEIDMIAVDPDHQNDGIGLELLRFAIDRIAEQGILLVEIWTGGDPGHAPARHIYEKAGFTPLPLVHYYKAVSAKPASDKAVSAKPVNDKVRTG
ncbi:MAG: GNAT family N-acetyltransferase [Trebonia sp.]